MTQRDAILAALQAGRSLTPLDALDEFGCLRLGGRIHELRAAGYGIETEMVAAGNGKTVASYSLPREPRLLGLWGAS